MRHRGHRGPGIVRWPGIGLILVAVGCGTPEDTGGPTVCDPAGPGPFEQVYPASGEDFYHRDGVVVQIDAEQALAVAWSRDGQSVPATLERFGDLSVSTPDAPLDPLTAYEVRLQSDCHAVTLPIVTSAAGAVAQDPAVGVHTFAVAEADWLGALGISELIGAYVTLPLLFEVTAADAGRLVAAGDVDGEVDVCLPWTAMARVEQDVAWHRFASSDAIVVPFETEAGTTGYLRLVGPELSFTAYEDTLVGAVLAASVDMRTLALVGGGEELALSCDLLAKLGVDCDPCPDGSGTECLPVTLARLPTTTAADRALALADDPCALAECLDRPYCE